MKKLLSITKNTLLFKSNGNTKKTSTKIREKKNDFEFQFAMGKVIEEPLSFYSNDLEA